MAKRAFPDAFAELTKMMKGYQVPGVDWQELMASQQKNVEALNKANQVLLEGAQSVIQREVELLRQAIQEFAEASRGLMQEGDPQAHTQRRLELAKASFEAALRNMRELAEMAGQANREALATINQRALESFDEIRTAMAQKREGGAEKRESGATRS
jgi:phasin family protein